VGGPSRRPWGHSLLRNAPWADFLRLDSGLPDVAAETSAALPTVTGDVRALARHIVKLPVSDKNRLLTLVAVDQAAPARTGPQPCDCQGAGAGRLISTQAVTSITSGGHLLRARNAWAAGPRLGGRSGRLSRVLRRCQRISNLPG
jgi:hypothetical protein